MSNWELDINLTFKSSIKIYLTIFIESSYKNLLCEA